MTSRSAVREAVALVNGGDVVGLAEWAEVARTCRMVLGGQRQRDEAMEFAATVAGLVTEPYAPAGSQVGELNTALHSSAGVSLEQVRTVLAMVTHAARRADLPEGWEGLLAGVERAALTRHPAATVDGLGSVLQRWPLVVARVASTGSPRVASAVAHQQVAVLVVTRDLVARLDPGQAAVVDADRLGRRLDACIGLWRDQIGLWKAAADPTPPGAVEATALSVAAVGLRDALRAHPSTGDTVTALLRSGAGGNLLVAAALDPDRSSPLVTAARNLDALTSQISDTAPRIDLVAAPAAEVAMPTAPALPRVALQRPVPRSVEVWEPPAVDARSLTPVVEAELARRRDAGVAAQAALDGVAEARALLPEATASELAGLVWEGRQAVGVLVASVQPAIWSRVHRYHGDLEEKFAEAAVQVAAAAHRWDPQRARWLSYAILTSEWALTAQYRQLGGLPIPVRMDDNPAERFTPGGIDPKLLVSSLRDPADATAVAFDGARAADLSTRLPWPTNEILREAMGFNARGEPASLESISQRMNIPHTSVSRHVQWGVRRIRSQLGAEI